MMRPLGIRRLLDWMIRERERTGSVFGIPEEAFYRPADGLKAPAVEVFGERCGLPLGVAAGPHSQLAQNIVTACLCGARYVELKTVQIHDRLVIGKPCIDALDEGYNTEWSQELSLEESFSEYLGARAALCALEAGLGICRDVVFAASVGYDLAGIRSAPVDAFLSRMRDARVDPGGRRLSDECRSALAGLPWSVPDLGPQTSISVTLSTMHGCPTGEIEEICRHLMGRKRLTTLVKLNPTLLGRDEARAVLLGLGWSGIDPSASGFERDVRFGDAVAMVGRLREFARGEGVGFGVKLTNTLGVANREGKLPGAEKYLSGRALAPLTLLVAARLAEELGPDLCISYSGGASEGNLQELLEAGLRPVTVATELLKPGGYLRLNGMARRAEQAMASGLPEGLDTRTLRRMAEEARHAPLYRKGTRARGRARVSGALPLWDCVTAPCVLACPIGQQVPEYIRLLGQGKPADAFRVICRHNALPGVTGWICDHPCTEACARMDYEGPVLIREMKRIAVERGAGGAPPPARPGRSGRVAVIGAGPSGLTAASALARCGVAVTVFEKRERAGGVLTTVLPSYRLPGAVARSDLQRILSQGVELRLEADARFSLAALRDQGFTQVYVATGAEVARVLAMEGGGSVHPVLDLLRASNDASSYTAALHHDQVGVGRRIAVVGGGNTAVDGARTARRLTGVAWVGIVYRRTEEEMPADREELDLALAEGVELLTLLSPVSLCAGVLTCRRMALGAPGPDGRRRPEPLDELLRLDVDTVVSAIGESADAPLLASRGLAVGERGTLLVDPRTQETSVTDVFAGGDAVRGGGTVVLAMADARRAAREIARRLGVPWVPVHEATAPPGSTAAAKGRRLQASAPAAGDEEVARRESSRCLACDLSCDRCVEVCPNRANVAIAVPGLRDRTQILHLDELCNECGNCATFCLYEGLPYRDKLTLYGTPESFRSGSNPGFAIDEEGRLAGLRAGGDEGTALAVASAVTREHPYLLRRRPS